MEGVGGVAVMHWHRLKRLKCRVKLEIASQVH